MQLLKLNKQNFYFIFYNTCIEELGNKNKLVISGSNYKSLQLQDSPRIQQIQTLTAKAY